MTSAIVKTRTLTSYRLGEMCALFMFSRVGHVEGGQHEWMGVSSEIWSFNLINSPWICELIVPISQVYRYAQKKKWILLTFLIDAVQLRCCLPLPAPRSLVVVEPARPG